MAFLDSLLKKKNEVNKALSPFVSAGQNALNSILPKSSIAQPNKSIANQV
jgi:hypothetical protein